MDQRGWSRFEEDRWRRRTTELFDVPNTNFAGGVSTDQMLVGRVGAHGKDRFAWFRGRVERAHVFPFAVQRPTADMTAFAGQENTYGEKCSSARTNKRVSSRRTQFHIFFGSVSKEEQFVDGNWATG